ncbi:MAG: DUF6265 family protein [Vicinamibacterales bacterium]|jgi:hypothetical protein|nr:DUF6265 family protein [Vicinamibacterales bacterium]
MQRFLVVSALVLLVGAPALAQGPSAKVTDLAWMSGSYTSDTLEENWAEPKAGSIASLVRGVGDGATNMIELIVVEEEGDSLTLRLKQWDPGMQPRADGFQVMQLQELGNNKVVFKNTGEGGIQQLGYSLAGNTFTISVTTARGAFDIPLTRKAPQSPH